jgi:hypothetical protein
LAGQAPRAYDTRVAALFAANLGEASRVAKNLQTSIARTAHLFPLDGAGLEALDDEGKERLDAFRVRFADLQDLLAGKVFRSLLLLEEEQPVSQLDVLNAMEKRRIIPSFQAWKRLQDLRNAFMPDDPEHPNERADALTLAAHDAPELLGVLTRTQAYAQARFGLCPGEDPPR